MSFHKYRPPNVLQPLPPKGIFGGLGAGVAATNTLKLTGSSPRTSILDGMFTYSPPAVPRGTQPEYSTKDIISDVLQFPSISLKDSSVLSDTFTLDINSMNNNETITVVDNVILLPISFVMVEQFTDSLTESQVFSFTESVGLIDTLTQPVISATEGMLDDTSKVVSISGGSWSNTESVTITDTMKIPPITFIMVEQFTDSDKLQTYTNTDTVIPSDIGNQLKP